MSHRGYIIFAVYQVKRKTGFLFAFLCVLIYSACFVLFSSNTAIAKGIVQHAH